MLKQIDKIIIIVGCQRSGTTLLGQIIGAPKHALLLDETDVICLNEHGGYQNWLPAAIDDKLSANLAFQTILTEARNKYTSPQQRIVGTRSNLSLGKDINQLVLKAPNLTYSFDEIAKLKKPVRVIYIVRNPISVIASMLNLNHIDFVGNQLEIISNYPELSERYKHDISIMRDHSRSHYIRAAHLWKLKSSLFPYFEAANISSTLYHYESLVSDPKSACLDICQRLDIPFDAQMLNHQQVYQGIAQGQTDRTRPLDRFSLVKWKKDISPSQLSEITASLGKAMAALGY